MEVITFLAFVILIGAILGGNTLGGTVRKGCGFLALVIVLGSILLMVLQNLDERKIPDDKEVITTVDDSVYFEVKNDCPTYVRPNIESEISGGLIIGEEYFVEEADKFNYFYEITDNSGEKVFVRKPCLERR